MKKNVSTTPTTSVRKNVKKGLADLKALAAAEEVMISPEEMRAALAYDRKQVEPDTRVSEAAIEEIIAAPAELPRDYSEYELLGDEADAPKQPKKANKKEKKTMKDLEEVVVKANKASVRNKPVEYFPVASLAQAKEALGLEDPEIDLAFLDDVWYLNAKDEALKILAQADELGKQYDAQTGFVNTIMREHKAAVDSLGKRVSVADGDFAAARKRIEQYQSDFDKALAANPRHVDALAWGEKNPAGLAVYLGKVETAKQMHLMKACPQALTKMGEAQAALQKIKQELETENTEFDKRFAEAKLVGAQIWAERLSLVKKAQDILDGAGFEIVASSLTLKGE